MPANYVLLAERTVTQAVSSITLSNIPQTGYTDLVLKISARGTIDGDSLTLQFNGVTGSGNYASRMLVGNGSSASSNTPGQTNYILPGYTTTVTASTYGNLEIYIPNYTSTTAKSVSADNVQEGNQSSPVYTNLVAGLYSTSTSAINSITFGVGSGDLVANSTISLYGVAALGTTPVIAPKASGGDIVVNDGTYWYHAFLGSSVFTPTQALSCDVLVVAGGGAGGDGGSGGGAGAGGVFVPTTQSLTATNYVITVGAGGSGGLSSGSNSQFGALTAAIGGGYGGSGSDGANGGSGGGGYPAQAGGSSTQTSTGGTGYGNAGGSGGSFVSPYPSGGGGGAGGVGTNGSGTTTGNGGAGLNTWSSWLSPTGLGVSGFIAGGGGGGANQQYPGASAGTGGSGGGGNGGISGSVGVAGTISTGSGGGGSSKQPSGANTGGNGGSGVVIVRYLVAVP
jgi:hypothetical protein